MLQLPGRADPRIPVIVLLTTYVVLGITILGFNRSPAQIGAVVGAACALDVVLHRLIHGKWLLPLSAAITGLSLSILVNYAHGSVLAIVPVFFAIASKYVITCNGRHVFNPSLFGIVVALVVGADMISVAPAYQWGGGAAMAVFIVTAAVMSFGLRIRRTALILSFLTFYMVALGIRAWLTRYHVHPETLFMGALTSPAFYLFAFFMLTDPVTSPPSRRGQVWMALIIVAVDFVLHTRESLSTFFYAGFAYFLARWCVLQFQRIREHRRSRDAVPSMPRRWGWVGALGLFGWMAGQQAVAVGTAKDEGFRFSKIPLAVTGLAGQRSEVLTEVDPRLQHIAKWLLSVGDAAAVADFDNDGLQDVFLTYPLKHPDNRAALYRNTGDLEFQRVALPALATRLGDHKSYGLPSGALWFDYDNDGDADLFVSVGYGQSWLLKNLLSETGHATFAEAGADLGLADHSVSVSANVLDFDRDGDLDLLVGNSFAPYLSGYDEPRKLNVFDLPEPEYAGDRRMLNIMHRTWHDADNGGENYFYENQGGVFSRRDVTELGLDGTRWTIDIGTGDLDKDGWTDLYLANDFGPDEIFLNRAGVFERLTGRFSGEPGRDTYKGMNVSLADIDNNGTLDIYVSNVHEPLQAEGSLLWINSGDFDRRGTRALRDEASARNSLNAQRFGWGAAVGDLNRDGRLDIVQANGMVDDSYDDLYEGCPDYWYWNEKIALTGPDVHGYADRWADLRGRCIFPDEADRVMMNQGEFFIDVAESAGFAEATSSRGIALADFDNDGDLDAIVTHQFDSVAVFRNDATVPRQWLGLDLAGNGVSCNRDAIGTSVDIRYVDQKEQLRQYREVVASNGFSAQGDARLLVGLGSHDGPVDIQINWCGKASQSLSLEAGTYHTINQTD